MATAENIILKSRKLPAAADFHFLRSEGLRYIERMASRYWTDYNVHDPGVTIMEALCYAITELSYRTGFDIRDLLTNRDGTISQPFFTPREIMTTAPLTLLDYRKLLIDINGVANAWIFPVNNLGDAPDWVRAKGATEVPLYPDCKAEALSFEETHHEPVAMRGLYHVRLDLDTTDEYGDLNSGDIDITLQRKAIAGAKLTCLMPPVNKIDLMQLAIYATRLPDRVEVYIAERNAAGNAIRWRVYLEYNYTETRVIKHEYEVVVAIRVPVEAETPTGETDLEDEETQYQPTFEEYVKQELEVQSMQQRILTLYYQKMLLTHDIMRQVWATLHGNRNLCEDWWTVDTISSTPVAFCADIDVQPGADIEAIYAQVVIALEQYCNPTLVFYNLKEMQDLQLSTDAIFEGPALRNGFLLNEQVTGSEIKNKLLGSEVIEAIMQIDGVVAVRNLVMTAYDDNGRPVLPSQQWLVHLQTDHKPIPDMERSKFTFFKNQVPFHINAVEAADSLLYQKGLLQSRKISSSELDFQVAAGRYLELDKYSSIQHDLPEIYGTGPAGLPDAASPERKAQARQLKAYLMFYDQLLAGFFSQLHHAKDLMNLDSSLSASYFQQFLQDWEDDPENGIHHIKAIYTNPGLLKQVFAQPAADDPAAVKLLRNKLVETPRQQFNRRNRFLDHLIARFAETFNDYVLSRYASQSAAGEQELIADKIRFIRDYPQTSSRRGLGANLTLPVWNTENASGLQKRIARLSGINQAGHRSLFRFPLPVVTEDSNGFFTFVLADENAGGEKYLQPATSLNSEREAWQMANEIYKHMRSADRYSVKSYGAYHVVQLSNGHEVIAVSPNTYDTKEEAQAMIEVMLQKFQLPQDAEVLHVIEHFLLRPRFAPPVVEGIPGADIYRLMDVCLPDDCSYCGEEDPYSFRISVVLPYWPERFRDNGFRTFFERMVRMECPAHIHAKICWVNYATMHRFETAYRQWLEVLKDYNAFIVPDTSLQSKLMHAANQLVTVMKDLNSVYPEATLHDCAEGTTNPVMLGHTSLGSY